MTAVKEKIVGAITVMSGTDAEELWKIIVQKYAPVSWDDIEEVEPDEIDLQMQKKKKKDPDCHVFTKESEINW